MDLFIVIPLMLLAEDCMEMMERGGSETKLEELRSTVILAVKGLHDQRSNHYLAEALFRELPGKMGRREPLLLRGAPNVNVNQEDELQEMVQVVRNHWPVSMVKTGLDGRSDREARCIGGISKNLEQFNPSSMWRNSTTPCAATEHPSCKSVIFKKVFASRQRN